MRAHLKIITTSTWDSDFFEKFRSLKNRLHKNELYHFHENIKDLKQFFGEDTPFNKNNEWQCWMVMDGDRPIARLGVSLPKYWEKPLFVPTGFYEAEKISAEELSLIFNEAEAWAKKRNVAELRLPMQGGFFGSYRALIPNKNIPFISDPDTLPYYFAQWESLNFKPCGAWSTSEVNIERMIKNSQEILQKFYKQNKIPGVTLRPVDIKNWREELKIIRELFLDSFSKMPEYMPISEEEFLFFYDPLKHLAHPEYCLIIEDQGKPIAFLLSLFDPTEIMIKIEKKLWFLPKLARDIIAYPLLRKNKHRFLLPYSGKIAAADKVKGVMAYLFLESLSKVPKSEKVCYFGYVADGSPTYKTATPGTYKEITKYAMFKKVLS